MKKIYYLLLLSAVLSCTKEEGILGTTTTVRMNFEALYDGKPLVINQPYTYPDGHQIAFNQFNFFISSIALLEAGSDDEVDLLEVNFAEFSDMATPASVRPISFTKFKVPTGQYKGIRIGIGVPSELNDPSASFFGAGHPLRVHFDTHFWPAANSFKFMQIKGIYDFNNDGILSASPADRVFSLEPARNENYAMVVIFQPLELQENKPFDLNFYVDLMKLYQKGSTVLDLGNVSNLNTADPNNLALAKYLMGNFQQALSIK